MGLTRGRYAGGKAVASGRPQAGSVLDRASSASRGNWPRVYQDIVGRPRCQEVGPGRAPERQIEGVCGEFRGGRDRSRKRPVSGGEFLAVVEDERDAGQLGMSDPDMDPRRPYVMPAAGLEHVYRPDCPPVPRSFLATGWR